MRSSRAARLLVLLAACALVLTGCGAAHREAPDRAYGVASTGHLRVVAVGDIACPVGQVGTARTCREGATASLARRLRPDLVLTLGDHQYDDGSLAQFRGSYDRTWGALRAITRPAIGNHEYRTAGAAGYYDYFRGRQPGPPGYYRVSGGGWDVYVLNSNCDRVSCSQEARWLRAQMTAHPSRCSLVTMHHPRYSSGLEHGNDAAVRGLWKAAYDHRNDVVLAGHDHDYERFRPMDADGHVKPRRGMVSFVVGTGGVNLYHLGTRKKGSAYFQDRTAGVLLLDLQPRAWSWSFRSTTGAQLDGGSRTCR